MVKVRVRLLGEGVVVIVERIAYIFWWWERNGK